MAGWPTGQFPCHSPWPSPQQHPALPGSLCVLRRCPQIHKSVLVHGNHKRPPLPPPLIWFAIGLRLQHFNMAPQLIHLFLVDSKNTKSRHLISAAMSTRIYLWSGKAGVSQNLRVDGCALLDSALNTGTYKLHPFRS